MITSTRQRPASGRCLAGRDCEPVTDPLEHGDLPRSGRQGPSPRRAPAVAGRADGSGRPRRSRGRAARGRARTARRRPRLVTIQLRRLRRSALCRASSAWFIGIEVRHAPADAASTQGRRVDGCSVGQGQGHAADRLGGATSLDRLGVASLSGRGLTGARVRRKTSVETIELGLARILGSEGT